MRILWVSVSADATTGYGKITRDVCSRLLLDGRHDVISIAHGGDVIVWGGHREIKLPNGESLLTLPYINPQSDPSGAANMLKNYAKKYDADLAIGFWDAFALDWMPQAKIPFMQMIPIDGNMTRKWADCFKDSMGIIPYSNYGYSELRKFFSPSLLHYIPHGVDCNQFRPLDISKAELRKSLADTVVPAIPEDAFLMCTIEANYTDRKKLPLMLRTFSRFAKKHKDAHLYIHANVKAWTMKGYDLASQFVDLGITDRVHYPKYEPSMFPMTDEELNIILNASDLYVTNSCAEGFGIPLLESQAAGTPVLCPRNSSQTELVEGHGYIAENIDEYAYIDFPMYTPYGNQYPVCDQRSLLQKMEQAYIFPEVLKQCAKASTVFALKYDWPNVMESWFSMLDAAQGELQMWKSILA